MLFLVASVVKWLEKPSFVQLRSLLINLPKFILPFFLLQAMSATKRVVFMNMSMINLQEDALAKLDGLETNVKVKLNKLL